MDINKALDALPASLTPGATYAVKIGSEFKLYVADNDALPVPLWNPLLGSGNSMFALCPGSSQHTSTLAATLGNVADASTPGTLTPVIKFAAAANSHRDWRVTVPSNYSGRGFTFSWKGGTDNTDVGVFELEFRVLKIADASILTADLGVDTQTAVTITDTPPATPINKLNYSTTGTLSHANAGSPSPGDELVIRATRDVSVGSNNTGNLLLAKVLVVET